MSDESIGASGGTVQDNISSEPDATPPAPAGQPNMVPATLTRSAITYMTPALVESAKVDYMTGRFNTIDLAMKYNTTRMYFMHRVKSTMPESKEGWLAIALRKGISPKAEPPFERERMKDDVRKALRMDLLMGMTQADAAAKHSITAKKVEEVVARFKWGEEIERAKLKRKQDEEKAIRKLLAPRTREEKEEIEQAEEEDEDGSDISGQMQDFVKAASVQLKMITSDITKSNKRKEQIETGKLGNLIDKFAQIADAVKKMKAASAVDSGGGSGGSGRLIRPSIMDQASVAATDAAPTI